MNRTNVIAIGGVAGSILSLFALILFLLSLAGAPPDQAPTLTEARPIPVAPPMPK